MPSEARCSSLLAALLPWFARGTFYTVQPNEVGINLVFGRYTGKRPPASTPTGPGRSAR